jgi:hypothetical protein
MAKLEVKPTDVFRGYRGRPADAATVKAGLKTARMGPAGLVGKGRRRVMGEVGKTINEDWLSRLVGKGHKTLGKGAIGLEGMLGYLVLNMLFQGGMDIARQSQEGRLQERALEAQEGALTPEAMTERALQPITKAQRNAALAMLLKQMGANTGPLLAEGEVLT